MSETIGKSEFIDRVAWSALNGFCAANSMLPIRDTEYIEDSGGHRIWGFKAKIADGTELSSIKDNFGKYLYDFEQLNGEKFAFFPFMIRVYYYSELGAYIHLAVEQDATMSAH